MTSRPTAGRTLRNASLLLTLVLGAGQRLSAQNDYATPYAFNVFCGEGADGSADGTGTGAFFFKPAGLAVDSGGNLYVADLGNDTIREVTPAGVVTTLAGTAGAYGIVDGTGSAAEFKLPFGLTVDSNGNVFVADTDNNTIRKITKNGVVTTLAGTAGTAGYSNASGTSATFNQPGGIALDSSGNLYVVDGGNDVIREVTQAGVVTTVAGLADYPGSVDATGTDASFNDPQAITSDSSGNLYVADTGNNTIRKITSAGVVTTIAGQPGIGGSQDGTGSGATFNSPRGIAIDSSGNLYVADSANGLIRKVTQAGVVTTVAGSPNNYANIPGVGSTALFDVPVGIAVDSAGNLYVSQQAGNLVSKGTAVPSTVPSITSQPASQTVSPGSTVVFKASASGQPQPSYQWKFNGTALADGATVTGSAGPTLVLTGTTSASAGTYTCTATNSAGATTSSGATLSVSSTTDIGRLTNVSCLSQVESGSNVLIAGFVVGGSGTSGSEPLLVRASGPALEGVNSFYTAANVLSQPVLGLYQGESLLQSNTGWGTNTPYPSGEIASVAATVGAFAWPSTASADSALVPTLAVGPYTEVITGANNGDGYALAEVYDATPAGTYTPASPRLINIAARAYVSASPQILTAGFEIGGSTSRTVLIRASGPALLAFGVPDTLADPALGLYSKTGALIASNTKWGGDTTILDAANAVGAFQWSSLTSADSALLVTLPPGNYTAQVSGATGDTGVALVEVYEVP